MPRTPQRGTQPNLKHIIFGLQNRIRYLEDRVRCLADFQSIVLGIKDGIVYVAGIVAMCFVWIGVFTASKAWYMTNAKHAYGLIVMGAIVTILVLAVGTFLIGIVTNTLVSRTNRLFNR